MFTSQVVVPQVLHGHLIEVEAPVLHPFSGHQELQTATGQCFDEKRWPAPTHLPTAGCDIMRAATWKPLSRVQCRNTHCAMPRGSTAPWPPRGRFVPGLHLGAAHVVHDVGHGAQAVGAEEAVVGARKGGVLQPQAHVPALVRLATVYLHAPPRQGPPRVAGSAI